VHLFSSVVQKDLDIIIGTPDTFGLQVSETCKHQPSGPGRADDIILKGIKHKAGNHQSTDLVDCDAGFVILPWRK